MCGVAPVDMAWPNLITPCPPSFSHINHCMLSLIVVRVSPCDYVLLPRCRFAFVEYDSHRAAAMARRKLMNGRVFLWGHQLAVDWAEPELEVDEEIMAQVYTG